MNIFISYSHADRNFALKLSAALESDDFDVFIDNKIPIGNNIYRDIGKGIAKADAVIVIISEGYYKSDFPINETVSFLSYFDRGRMPLVIPIVLGEDTKVPSDLNRFNYLVIPYSESKGNASNAESTIHRLKKLDERIEKSTIQKVRILLASHNEKLKKAEEEKKSSQEKVQHGLSEYIESVFVNLKENEKKNRRFAFWLYLVSILFLATTIIIAVVFAKNEIMKTADLTSAVVYAVTCLLIIIVLVSLSKLLFTLAKSFMVESIRCSDRIHAISFGKFFLDAYGSEATRQEVIQAFSSWNIDNGGTSFRNQSTSDYDPKIEDILKVLTNKKSS